MKYISENQENTISFAANFASKLKENDVVAFKGGMGVGKTVFTRGIGRYFKVEDQVISPTYALVNHYYSIPPIYHFDFYRITSEEDLYSTGYYDYLGSGGIIIAEWSEKIMEALPENTIFVTMKYIDDERREIIIEGDERFDNTSS